MKSRRDQAHEIFKEEQAKQQRMAARVLFESVFMRLRNELGLSETVARTYTRWALNAAREEARNYHGTDRTARIDVSKLIIRYKGGVITEIDISKSHVVERHSGVILVFLPGFSHVKYDVDSPQIDSITYF